MLTIGCHLSSAKGNRAMVETAASIGANTYAFFTRNPRGSRAKSVDREDCAQAVEMLNNLNFGVVVAHGSYTMNLCTKDADARKFAAEVLEEDLQRMTYLPGQYYNFHPGSHVGQGYEAGIDYIVEGLRYALRSRYPVTVLLETMAGKGSEVGCTFHQLKHIIDGVGSDQIGICMDTCHVWDGGYNLSENLDGVLNEFDQIIGLNRLKALHLNDSKNPCGAHKDRHACIGKGFLGLETFRKIVNHPALCNLPMILETPNELPGYAEEIRLLRQMQGDF